MRRRFLAGIAVAAVIGSAMVSTATPVAAKPVNTIAGVERYLEQIRDDPERLRAFLYDLPKGGDLHNHLSGAVSTETLISLAADDDLCIDTATFVAAKPPCGPSQRPAQDAEKDEQFRAQVIGAWSMEGFQRGQGETGHDHFFATFGKFGAVTGPHRPELLADVVERAGEQHELYLEEMTTRQGDPVFALSQKIPFNPDFSTMLHGILATGELPKIVAAARAETDQDEARYRELLHCGTSQALPGCAVTVRYIQQVGRTSDPNVVFTYMVYGFALAEADHRNVAVNMVQAEENPISLRDYELHMRMLDYLRKVYPTAHISLHAGELTPALASPKDLSFHIREAVLTGHAERIGHGVDITHETNWPAFMHLMAGRHVMVESPPTSNDQILEVRGWQHPFPVYRAFGVPVAIATDDEGVSRTDLTHEYQRDVVDYHLHYSDLKKLVRTTLEHAFLNGTSLWRAPDDFHPTSACVHDTLGSPEPSAPCKQLLADSPKASLQWQEEALFTAFEYHYSHND